MMSENWKIVLRYAQDHGVNINPSNPLPGERASLHRLFGTQQRHDETMFALLETWAAKIREDDANQN